MSTEEDRTNDIEYDRMADEVFPYLDALKEDGSINMLESPKFIMEEFGISKYTARSLVRSWMDSKKKLLRTG